MTLPKPLDATLVIPAYNRADLIAETIQSALRQSIPFREIIVVNDGSSDDTEAVVGSFGASVTLITTQNQGVQAARNTGVQASKSELVALLDSDDLLEAEHLACVGSWMQTGAPTDIVYCNFVTFDEASEHADKFSGAPAGYFDGALQDGDFLYAIPALYKRSLSYQPLFSSGHIFRKTFYQAIGGYDPKFNRVGAEDWEFTLRAIAQGHVAVCTRPLVRIRKHAGNDSHDAMRMNLGEADILDYALAQHPGADKFSAEILASVDARRVRAFDAAFALGNFELAAQIEHKLRNKPTDIKSRLKHFILKSPPPLRKLLWRASQN